MQTLLKKGVVLTAYFAIACFASPSVAPQVLPSDAASVSESDGTWNDYWRARGVSPSPPRDFLDDWSEPPEVVNHTNGALTDEIVRQWVAADLRRRAGLFWAARYLRLDLVNAGIFGPPGLSGLDRAFEDQRAKGVVAVDCRMRADVVAAGVIAVSKDLREKTRPHLTEFLLVETFRMTGKACRSFLADGHMALSYCGPPDCPAPGELGWHVGAGEFREDPVIGRLWYETHEWSCLVDATVPQDEICELVRSGLESVE